MESNDKMAALSFQTSIASRLRGGGEDWGGGGRGGGGLGEGGKGGKLRGREVCRVGVELRGAEWGSPRAVHGYTDTGREN